MQIGAKIKRLRLKNGLTQEELGERTDLSKGFISQLERDMNSPSIETLFSLLEVLGTSPKEFFDDEEDMKVVYSAEDHTVHIDEDAGYEIDWLIPTSNKKEMEPVYLTLREKSQFRAFEPSLAETFIYVIEGKIRLILGENEYFARTGDSIYYSASHSHRVVNEHAGKSELIVVATHSYL
ncbi:helix-turn-helix domain-containing protein [Planomicrobium sp. CPCC 101079]|uniref:helix-turn-helix domain-containing protein n=1 Tax=Planomicrobium sp. CPCC 101079 TaxID=2599618 RepID=UPI0011B81D68|nr:XRE family transcriptional regulator [Planomicrobium sp. CPCC 101079]TWT04781.1 XRE family transcriptional regulator [Planomicrobium sp. CPCC 101079]